MNLPARLGFVRESSIAATFDEDNSAKKLIIHIQDVHCHFEAQTNSARILKRLLAHSPVELKLVELEGGTGSIDTSLLASIPEPELRNQIATALLKKGKIGASEFLSITATSAPQIHGPEDPKLYFTNLSFFQKNLRLRRHAQDVLEKAGEALSGIQNRLETRRLRRLSRSHEAFSSGALALDEYLAVLQEAAAGAGLELDDYPNLALMEHARHELKAVNLSAVQSEHQRLLEAMSSSVSRERMSEILAKTMYYRLERLSSEAYFFWLTQNAPVDERTYPNLSRYCRYLEFFSRMDKEQLFEEMDVLLKRLRYKLAGSADLRRLYDSIETVRLLKSLHRLELTRRDHEAYSRDPSSFSMAAVLDFVRRYDSRDTGSDPAGDLEVLDRNAALATGFYQSALRRDEALVSNMVAEMERRGARIAVLVAGGFHTQGIVKNIRRRGLDYVVISPRLTRFNAATPYLSIMSDERSALENSVDAMRRSSESSTIAAIPSFQPVEPLQRLLDEPATSDEMKAMLRTKMESLVLFNVLSLAYVEILGVLRSWKGARGLEDFEALQPPVQDIFSRWSKIYVAAARLQGAGEDEAERRRNLFRDFDRGIDVFDVEQIGNRVFLTLSVYGAYRGLVVDPTLEGERLIRTLDRLELLELDVFSLIKRAQTLAAGILDKSRAVTFPELVAADPELARLTQVLKEAPFPYVEARVPKNYRNVSRDEVLSRHETLMNLQAPLRDRLTAAADILRLSDEAPQFSNFRRSVDLFLEELSRTFWNFGHVVAWTYLDPALINPLKAVHARLGEDHAGRTAIQNHLELIQSLFHVRDRGSVVPRFSTQDRLRLVNERIKKILDRTLESSSIEETLNDEARPLRVDLLRDAVREAPRVVYDADMDLSNSLALFRLLENSHPGLEVWGSDKVLYGYLVKTADDDAFVIGEDGGVLWVAGLRDDVPGRLKSLEAARQIVSRNKGALKKQGNLERKGFRIERLSLIAPLAEEAIARGRGFKAEERDAYAPLSRRAAIHTNFNHILSHYYFEPAQADQVVSYLRGMGQTMSDGALFQIGRGAADAMTYWTYQKVDGELRLVDFALASRDEGWKGAMPLTISLEAGVSETFLWSFGLPLSVAAMDNPAFQVVCAAGLLIAHPGIRSALRRVARAAASTAARSFRTAYDLAGRAANWMVSTLKSRMGKKLLSFLTGAAAALMISTARVSVAQAQEPPETPPVVPTRVERFENPFEIRPLTLLPERDPFLGRELSAGVLFNQGYDYRLRFDADLTNRWRFHFLHSRSGLYNDTIDPGALSLFEDNAHIFGLFTGYLGPFEYARAMRQLPIGSELTRLGFSFRNPNSPFWIRMVAGVGAYQFPALHGERYELERTEIRPFGGIDLGLDYRFLERPWHTLHWQTELDLHYQEMLRDRMVNPEGVDATRLVSRVWSDFRLLNGRLVLTPFMETGFTPQPIFNVLLRGAQMPDGATNDQIAREIIQWGTARAGMMAFPYDDRGGPIDPDDLFGLAEHGVIRFVSTPVIWHTFEGRITATPWDFLQLRAGGGVHLTWRPQVEFRMADVQEDPSGVLSDDYLKDNWSLFFDPIPFVRTGISGAVFRDLRADFDWQGLWVSNLPISHRVSARLRWQPRWVRGTELDLLYRYSNFPEGDPFGTVQSLRPNLDHHFGIDLKYRWSPVEQKGSHGANPVARVTSRSDGSVRIENIEARPGKPSMGWLRRAYEKLRMKFVEPMVAETMRTFKERYPKVKLERFKVFLSDSHRLASILHSDNLDHEIHLHQNLFQPWRVIWSRILSIFGLARDSRKWVELAAFSLAHEALRHPLVDIDHRDFSRFAKVFPELHGLYTQAGAAGQDILREFLEEAIVVYWDLVEDFLPSSPERQAFILDALSDAEPSDGSGVQNYRALLNRARTLPSNEIMNAVVGFLLKDPRFASALPQHTYTSFIRLAQVLSRQWILKVPPAARIEREEGVTRREFGILALKGLGSIGMAMLLKACGVPEEAWELHRHEIVTIEDAESGSVSTVPGALPPVVLPNTVDAEARSSSDPDHVFGGNQAWLVTADPTVEPVEEDRDVTVFLDLTTAAESDNPLFPEARNLNQYDLNSFSYVSNGVSHTLLFVDNDGTSYQIPVNIPDADPEHLYRIRIDELLKSLVLNGLKPTDTDLYITYRAGNRLVINGWSPNPLTIPILTGKTGLEKRTVGKGAISNGDFRWVDRRDIEPSKQADYETKIGNALSILKDLNRFQRWTGQYRLNITEDADHYLDFTGHIGVDTDFLEDGIYSAPFLALLLDHELAHAAGLGEKDAILSNIETYATLKEKFVQAFPADLVGKYSYLQLMEQGISMSPELRPGSVESFMDGRPELFQAVPGFAGDLAEGILLKAAEQVPDWGRDDQALPILNIMRSTLARESEDLDPLLQENSLDRLLLQTLEQLAVRDDVRLDEIRNMAAGLASARMGREKTGSPERGAAAALKALENDMTLLLVRVFGLMRAGDYSPWNVRSEVLSEDAAVSGDKRVEDLPELRQEIAGEDETAATVFHRTLVITRDAQVQVNGKPLSALSGQAVSAIRGFMQKIDPGADRLVIEFPGGEWFSSRRIGRVLTGILAYPDRLKDGLVLAGFSDGSLVRTRMDGGIVRVEIVSQRRRWAQLYSEQAQAVWTRLDQTLEARGALETPPVKLVVLGADSLNVRVARDAEGRPAPEMEDAKFADLYRASRNIPHPAVPGSAVKWVIPVVVAEPLGADERRLIEKGLFDDFLSRHPEWSGDARHNILIRVIGPEDENAGENLIRVAEDTVLEGRIRVDRSKDLLLLLSQRESERLTLRDVLPWIVSGSLDEKKLMIIAELLAADGRSASMSEEILSIIREMDPGTLADLNERKIFQPRPLMEQMSLQLNASRMVETMA